MTYYTTCTTCAIAIQNDDYSGIDPRDTAAIADNIASMGLVALADSAEFDSFICDGCMGNIYGPAYTFEPLEVSA